ncbi:4,5-DOPA dioxygenase extradiol [Pontibacter sp. SGAir0037]|uniref:4,5-DOPA-extradiol-dioxygenase n=1 Tax=Pontibacter sp. SGAir0037 TaxID=2571030 RepID=UPI001F116E75|nr:4,5-DOPA dioxygenase extradiol [Pontibacter sp. SGAir0037]
MPAYFLGHGSPMNALEENEFTRTWQHIGQDLPKPRAILCISAHWETKGTFVTAMEAPRTIHDFYGFPRALFEVQYPAAGNKEVAELTQQLVQKTQIGLDHEWGFDHGSWSVIRHIYPQADVPLLQLSIDYSKPAVWHYELAKELSELRKKGVLIIGSGNIVHNLRTINWQQKEGGYDWAEEVNESVKNLILQDNHRPLQQFEKLGSAAALAIPTPEHYLPLLYTLGVKEEGEQVSFLNDKLLMGSLSMTSVKVG